MYERCIALCINAEIGDVMGFWMKFCDQYTKLYWCIDVRNMSNYSCRLQFFLCFFEWMIGFSSYFLIGVNVSERPFHVVYGCANDHRRNKYTNESNFLYLNAKMCFQSHDLCLFTLFACVSGWYIPHIIYVCLSVTTCFPFSFLFEEWLAKLSIKE